MTAEVLYEKHGAVAVLRIDNPPVNALSQPVRQGLQDGLAKAEEDPDIRSLLIVGEGRAFIAGADIKEFGKPLRAPMLPDLCLQLENSRLVIVASLHGFCLGGGLEVALGCHFRVAQPEACVGLPEVHLGLIPGAGGTQRLPRLTGVQAAIEAITTGRQIAAEEAHALGIIDSIEAGDPLQVGLSYALHLLQKDASPRPVSHMPTPVPIDWDAAEVVVARRARGQMSPAVALQAVRASCELPFDEGLAEERRLFEKLMKTDQREALIHIFLAQRSVGQLPELKDATSREVVKLGIVGGGTMGAGITAAALLSGLDVTLLELDVNTVEQAEARVSGLLAGSVTRGKIAPATRDALLTDQLQATTSYADLRDADLVIEAVAEDLDTKKSVFANLDAVCKPETVLATNTSYLDINEIAAATTRPGAVLGLHFFSPAHVMKLLEVVEARETHADVLATGFALAKRMDKIAVRAGVCDGFIGNRIMQAYRTAADHMVLDGASPFEIDAAVEAWGFAMGPFRVADLAGLDIGWEARKRRAPTQDARARVGLYADRLCEAGHFGKKTGLGYYRYDADGREQGANEAVAALIEEERRTRGITARTFACEEIQHRFVAAMANEGAKVLADEIANRPLDIDVVMIFGYGFPKYRGGPMKWADQQGLPVLLHKLEEYARGDPYFWSPAPLLRQLADAGHSFDDLNRSKG